jgi:hypothetical protein
MRRRKEGPDQGVKPNRHIHGIASSILKQSAVRCTHLFLWPRKSPVPQVAIDGDTLKIGVEGQETTPQDEEVCSGLDTRTGQRLSQLTSHHSAAYLHM